MPEDIAAIARAVRADTELVEPLPEELATCFGLELFGVPEGETSFDGKRISYDSLSPVYCRESYIARACALEAAERYRSGEPLSEDELDALARLLCVLPDAETREASPLRFPVKTSMSSSSSRHVPALRRLPR